MDNSVDNGVDIAVDIGVDIELVNTVYLAASGVGPEREPE